jgi:signal transduction histidine kinase
MQKFKISSFIFIIIILFLSAIVVGYNTLYNNIINNHNKETKILFYEIQNETSKLLTYLSYQYELEKPKLLKKHTIVLNYLKTHNYDASLNEIHDILNQNEQYSPYHIYITDKNLVINNTTFKEDIGFDLSFAKKGFDADANAKRIGISSPIFEKSSKNFLSYTDSYLPKENAKRILQVSYTYHNAAKRLQLLEQTIQQYTSVRDVKIYLFTDSGFINDIILTDYDTYKPNLKEIQSRINEGKTLQKKLKKDTLQTNFFIKKSIHYRAMYLSSKSVISNDTYIAYNILFDESEHLAKLHHLNLFIALITLLGIVAIFIIFKMRNKEKRLNEQDHFVKSSMHEIRTPLSVITLNNELRKRELGNDEYTHEIESALKTLQNSYDDMSFIVTQNKIDYMNETLDLASHLQTRIDYFQTIAQSNDKQIETIIKSNCHVHMSTIELTRLIDNNLSNAIKYSDRNSTITVSLNASSLSFHSVGTPIHDTKKVFHKYARENSVVGGYGLGLSIVKDIANKYDIDIQLHSLTKTGTLFTYTFKCHTDVTQET